MSQTLNSMKIFLGYGKAEDYKAYPGYTIKVIGKRVYSIHDDFYCKQCKSIGCKYCKWTGENISLKSSAIPQEFSLFRKFKKNSKSPGRLE